MQKYFDLVQNKVDMEQDIADTDVLVQALDRFYRRLQAMNTLCKDTDFAKYVIEYLSYHLNSMEQYKYFLELELRS